MEQQELDFLRSTVECLVNNKEAVKVERRVDDMGVLLTLSVAQEDMGKVIGKAGNTAKALRTILRVYGMNHNARINLKINEPQGGEKPIDDTSFLADA